MVTLNRPATMNASIPKKARYNQGTNAIQELAVTDVDGQMKSAVMTPAIEKRENLATLSMTDRKIKELNRVSAGFQLSLRLKTSLHDDIFDS